MAKIDAYANRTGTRRNLDALREHGWGLLLCASKKPTRDHRTEGFADYMLDNAAFKCRNSGELATERAAYWREAYQGPWRSLLAGHGEGAALVVVPDVYCGGSISLRISLASVESILGCGPPVVGEQTKLLIPVQDGMTTEQLRPHISPRVGLAVGGSTEWKWKTVAAWSWLARERSAHCHVLRANSARMVRWASAVGAHSFDGSGPSKFADCLPRIDSGRLPTTRVLPGLDIPPPFTPREGNTR